MRRLLLAALATAWCFSALAQGVNSGPASGTGYPAGSIAVTSSATGTTGAVVATLPAATSRITFICGFYATGNEAATGAVVAVTVVGTISGTLNFNVSHPVTPALGNLYVPDFTPCIPASGVSVAIVVTSAADAAGTNVAVTAWGYQALQ